MLFDFHDFGAVKRTQKRAYERARRWLAKIESSSYDWRAYQLEGVLRPRPLRTGSAKLG